MGVACRFNPDTSSTAPAPALSRGEATMTATHRDSEARHSKMPLKNSTI